MQNPNESRKERTRMKNTNKMKTAAKRGMNSVMGCLLSGLVVAGTGLVQQAQAADQQKPTVVVSLSTLNGEVRMLRETLARTMAALDQVKAAAGENKDLAAPYATFSSSYSDLEAQVAKLREHGTATRARAKETWEAWQKELTAMQNPNLREKAQKRFTAATGEFDKITEKVDAAKEGFAPLAADLKDISTYLKTDLSKDAVSSLSGNIWKMDRTTKTVDSKLADVNEQIERTMKKLPQS
jgi:predicted  nucleic acid-binding Zn-ribbon protein